MIGESNGGGGTVSKRYERISQRGPLRDPTGSLDHDFYAVDLGHHFFQGRVVVPHFGSAFSHARGGYAGGFVAIILLQASIATHLHAQATSPTAAPPEIAASLPSGQYAGRAHKDGKAFAVSLVIEQTKPGGRLTGTVVVHKAPAPCEASFPIGGEILPGGSVHIESKEGAFHGCERTFDLKLVGDELTGTLVAPEGAFPIKLTKQ